MLIVTADDLGRSVGETDAAIACFRARRISTASAMVFMKDSARAATLAINAGMAVGLHLNLSQPFDAGIVPDHLRRQQLRIARFVKSHRYSLILYHPLLNGAFREVIAAQFVEFERLYGYPPAHVDGHQHYHLATNVLLQRLLPAGARVRRSFTFQPGQRGWLNRKYRSLVDARLASRQDIVDEFHSLSACLDAVSLQDLVERAADCRVELMAHPVRPAEFECLMGSKFESIPVESIRR